MPTLYSIDGNVVSTRAPQREGGRSPTCDVSKRLSLALALGQGFLSSGAVIRLRGGVFVFSGQRLNCA